MIIPGNIVGASGSGSNSLSYSLIFNNTTDWSGTEAPYTITILGAVHAFIGEVFIEVWIKEGDTYKKSFELYSDVSYKISIDPTTKNVVLTSDTKFEGKVIISGSKVPSNVIPIASHEQAGIVRIGSGFSVDSNGIITIDVDSIPVAKETTYTITFPASGWVASTLYNFEQTISEGQAFGIVSNDNPIVGIIPTSETRDELIAEYEAFELITRYVTGDNSVTLYCLDEAPAVDLTIQFKVVR